MTSCPFGGSDEIHLSQAGDQVWIQQCGAVHEIPLADLGEALDITGTPEDLDRTRLLSTVDGVTVTWGLRWETTDATWPIHTGRIEVSEPGD
jgi:hypothetical protein